MISPMLAKKYEDFKNSVLYPCYVQPKLDGIRCIAEMKNGVCTLYSRTGKELYIQHIKNALEGCNLSDILLDGELYNHSIKFEKICGLSTSKSTKEESTCLEYHVYDTAIENLTFWQRTTRLKNLKFNSPFIKIVETIISNNEKETNRLYKKFKNDGYEGAIVRVSDSYYTGSRTENLLKMKTFEDAEFKIIGIKSGVGKMENHAVFECETSEKKTFSCKMEGSYDYLKEIFLNQSLALGKKLTVRFQGLTSNNIPRFPVGVCIRNYE